MPAWRKRVYGFRPLAPLGVARLCKQEAKAVIKPSCSNMLLLFLQQMERSFAGGTAVYDRRSSKSMDDVVIVGACRTACAKVWRRRIGGECMEDGRALAPLWFQKPATIFAFHDKVQQAMCVLRGGLRPTCWHC